jgi:hypothetical protein
MFLITLNGNDAFLALQVGALTIPGQHEPIQYFATLIPVWLLRIPLCHNLHLISLSIIKTILW